LPFHYFTIGNKASVPFTRAQLLYCSSKWINKWRNLGWRI
jgi:hypothetical protein